MSEQPEVEIIGRLMALAARYGLEELEVEEGDLRITLRATEPMLSDEEGEGTGRYLLWQPPMWADTEAQKEQSGRPETAIPLRAPLTGHFYRSSSPSDPAFVEVGQEVEEGQVVALIEAMKVFSEITAEQAGTIVEIVPENGRLVQRGDVLMYLDPD